MCARKRKTIRLQDAIDALDKAPDRAVAAIGRRRQPGQGRTHPVSRDEWRSALISGAVDPAEMLHSIRLAKRLTESWGDNDATR